MKNEKFSMHSWQKITSIYQAIIDHSFIQELTAGTLEKKKFSYYLEQDTVYLNNFSKAMALIAAKSSSLSHCQLFLQFAQETLIVEQTLVHQFFKKKFAWVNSNQLAPTTFSYSNYLLSTCALAPIEVAIAAVLPCFWIYLNVGKYIQKNMVCPNPFEQWICTYAGEEFSKSTKKAIAIYDQLASSTTSAIQNKMQDSFYQSSVLEWHFWNDAYHLHTLSIT